MKQFEKLLEELFVKYPQLMSEKWFRMLESNVRKEITRRDRIMDLAGIV